MFYNSSITYKQISSYTYPYRLYHWVMTSIDMQRGQNVQQIKKGKIYIFAYICMSFICQKSKSNKLATS